MVLRHCRTCNKMSATASTSQMNKSKPPPLKWEFDIVLQRLFPFLDSVDQRRFSIVNRTMQAWSEEAAKVHLRRNHIPDNELKRFFLFTSTCKRNLTRKLMFDKYKELRLRGVVNTASQLPVNRASLSVLIFFLYVNNRRALEHLVHCSKQFFPALRRAFLQTWLRIQMFACRYPINRGSNPTNVDKTMKRSTTSQLNDKKRPILSCDQEAAKRRRIVPRRVVPRRQRKSVQRFQPEATKLIDDHSDDDCESCGDSAIEERSEDSDSEGSLKDFIVDSDDEEDESHDSGDNEKELSSYETSSESGFSVYSDED